MKKLLVILGIVTIAYSLLVFTYIYNDLNKPKKTVTNVQAVEQPPTVKLNADTIFNLVNAERAKNGLQPLIRDARLDATAQARADDMVARNYFSHNDPATGEKMIDKQDAGCHFSENISDGIYSDNGDFNKNVVRGWMQSKPHHDAILLAEYNTTGLAVSGNKVVQHFCTR
jgi:uncharacterized protein YkwD